MEKDIHYIIARVLSNEASADDVLALSRWLNEQDGNEKTFLRINSYWTADVSDSRIPPPDAAAEKVLRQITRRKQGFVFSLSRRMISPAAAVVVAMLIAAGALCYAAIRKAEIIHDVYNFYTCAAGDRRATFVLDDGTMIVLNKHSRMTYSDRYGKEDRRVRIDGEAFVDVAPNPVLPFEVGFEGHYGDDVSIKALGTIFNVRADTEAGIIMATLVEGSISFGAHGHEIILTPAQQVAFSRGQGNLSLRNVDVEEEIAWKDGLIKYKSISLAGLLDDLSRIYGLRILIADKRLAATDVTVSGTFEDGQPIEDVLDVIAKSLPFKWTKRDNVYYIR